MAMNPRLLRPRASSVPLWIAATYGVSSEQSPYWRENGLFFVSTDGANFWNIGDDRGVLIPSEGINDPTILQWQGAYYVCYSGGGGEAGAIGTRFVAVDRSTDLITWTRITSFLADNTSGGVAVPSWVVDASGPAIIGVLDPPHKIIVLRPPAPAPSTWAGAWSSAIMTDASAQELNQGNTYVAYKNGTYYMVYNDVAWAGYKKRTSSSLTSGWSSPSSLGISGEADAGDSQTITILPDGKFRFYASNGNSLTGEQWYWESNDFSNWGAAVSLSFVGQDAEFQINWSHVSRITVSSALYARLRTFIPPPPPPPPPPETILLLHFDGTNGSTSFTDSSANNFAITSSGSAEISTAQSKFGGSSLYVDGDGWVSASSATAFTFGTQDFTLECWAKDNGSSTADCAIITTADPSDEQGVFLGTNNNNVEWLIGAGSWITQRVSSSSMTDGEWRHIALVRSGNNYTLYFDGVVIDTYTNSVSLTNTNELIRIGGRTTYGNYFTGWIDEVRISIGARYTSAFTPPTAAFSE